MSKKIKVRETLLSELASKVVEEFEYCLNACNDECFCDYLLQELEDEEKKDVMFEKIYEAIEESVTLIELKILNDSNEDSCNFHILYKKLHKYFKEKIEECEETEESIFNSVYEDETYCVIFETMPGFVENPESKYSKKFDDRPKKQRLDLNKIQDAFKR